MSKQAQRNQQKRAAKREAKAAEEAANAGPVRSSSASSGDLTALSLARGSCIVEYAPKVLDFLKNGENGENGEAKPPKESKDRMFYACRLGRHYPLEPAEPAEGEEGEKAKEEPVAEATASATYAQLSSRLAWMNSLGLAEPKNAEDAVAKWQQIRHLEGIAVPRQDRCEFLAVPTAILPCSVGVGDASRLSVSFLLRLFTLAGAVAETVSLLIPLETMEKVPQVPLSQCPVKFRVAATLALNALMLLFFAWELVWRMNFFVKFLVVGLLTLHAHSVKPPAA
eukprot:s1970_g2.t1